MGFTDYREDLVHSYEFCFEATNDAVISGMETSGTLLSTQKLFALEFEL